MNLGMAYTLVAPMTAQTVSIDLFELNAPSDSCVLILSGYIGQVSDFGDAQAENLKIQFIKGFTTSGSGGSALTPMPSQHGFAAAGGSYEANNTTLATSGTNLTMHEDAFNVAIGYNLRDLPEEFKMLSPSERVVVRIAAPADSLTMGGTLNIIEIGG